MERFNTLKITFVFIITIVIPSVFLSAFAYQAIEGERFARRKERHRHLVREASTLAHDVEDGVKAPARSFREAAARLGERMDHPQDTLAALAELRARILSETAAPVDTTAPLFLYAPDGQRMFPAGRQTPRSSDAATAITDARNVARIGSRSTAIDLLHRLESSPDLGTQLAAKLESAQISAATNDEFELRLASRALEEVIDKPIDVIDPLGRPVVALARFEHALIAAGLRERPAYQKRLVALLRELEARAAHLPAEATNHLAIKAAGLLLSEGTQFEPEARRGTAVAESRMKLEERAERVDLAMSADLRSLLRARRKAEGSDAKLPGAPADVAPERLFLRRGADTFLAAPLERADGTLVALALVPVDVDRLALHVVADRITARVSDEDTIVFETSAAAPLGEEDLDVGRRTLAPPLDALQVIARARVSEDVPAREQTTMKLWLIALMVGGIFAGAVVTTRTVVREAKAAELKSDFVTNVTHELRTPLTSIRMFIETLEHGRVENEAEAKECLGIMARETDRLTRLIERLLAFSKIESRKWRFKFSYVPPLELVEAAIHLLRQQLQMKEDAPPPVLVEMVQDVARVAVDKDAMVEVLLNLLTNAWKYTPAEGRKVRVMISERRKQVVIDVEDNGIGVPRRDRRRIWKKFERGSNAEKGRIEGSGIGLTLALSIARGHGGTVTLTPLKQGSRFSLILPKLTPTKGH